MRELTKRQSEIYDYIKHIVQTKGYPPSVRELVKQLAWHLVPQYMDIYQD